MMLETNFCQILNDYFTNFWTVLGAAEILLMDILQATKWENSGLKSMPNHYFNVSRSSLAFASRHRFVLISLSTMELFSKSIWKLAASAQVVSWCCL